MEQQFDYIVVGQGIAGSVLSLCLLEKNCSVLVIDNGHISSSSKIAGGITHPMSFRKMILSWKAKELIPFAEGFYEARVGQPSIFKKLEMLRIFSSYEEQNNWLAKSTLREFEQVLSYWEGSLEAFEIPAPFGIGKVNLASRLDMPAFLNEIKLKLSNNHQLITAEFDHDCITLSDDYVQYKNFRAKGIIYCEGYKYINNPFFSYLPNNLTKGELLIIKTNKLPDKLLSKGIFTVKISSDQYLVGATFAWHDHQLNTTANAKHELLQKLEALGCNSYEIIEQRVGIRPTIPDRKPIIGQHPTLNRIYIFNGLGSKGVSIAPYFAHQFANHLVNGTLLDDDINVARFSKKHLHKFQA